MGYNRSGQHPQQVLKSKWLGHALRKPRDNTTRQVLQCNPQGRRRVGRPRNNWRRDIAAKIKHTGYEWAQLEQQAQYHIKWKSIVSGLCSLME
jgi:hypothetical protein